MGIPRPGTTPRPTASRKSIHSDYSAVPLFRADTEAYGEARAKAIMDESRHNTVYSRTSCSRADPAAARLQADRGDRTLVESWTSGWSAPPTAARAHDHVQPPHQRADLGRRPRRSRDLRARSAGGSPGTATKGQRAAPLHARRGGAGTTVTDGTSNRPNAQPVPRLDQVHDMSL